MSRFDSGGGRFRGFIQSVQAYRLHKKWAQHGYLALLIETIYSRPKNDPEATIFLPGDQQLKTAILSFIYS